MSGGRSSPNPGKIRLKVKVVLDRPGMTDRFFTTYVFFPKGNSYGQLNRMLNKKYLNRFPTGYVYPVKITECF